jgi:hypothetical protein
MYFGSNKRNYLIDLIENPEKKVVIKKTLTNKKNLFHPTFWDYHLLNK